MAPPAPENAGALAPGLGRGALKACGSHLPLPQAPGFSEAHREAAVPCLPAWAMGSLAGPHSIAGGVALGTAPCLPTLTPGLASLSPSNLSPPTGRDSSVKRSGARAWSQAGLSSTPRLRTSGHIRLSVPQFPPLYSRISPPSCSCPDMPCHHLPFLTLTLLPLICTPSHLADKFLFCSCSLLQGAFLCELLSSSAGVGLQPSDTW